MQSHLESELEQITAAGLFKSERVIAGAQDVEIKLTDGSKVLNFCANNYLGLSSDPRVCEAAKRAIDTHGFGMSCAVHLRHPGHSQRTRSEDCGISPHRRHHFIRRSIRCERRGIRAVARPGRCYHLRCVEPRQHHYGVRLCKAARYRYANDDMADLEAQLKKAQAANHRFKVIVTDGVFSMDGYVAQIDKICDLAEQYDALVMVDECHATGSSVKRAGDIELRDALGRVDIITGTLARPWAVHGWVHDGRKEIIEMLRQRSRPYLFSNSLAPSIVGASLEVFNMPERSPPNSATDWRRTRPTSKRACAASGSPSKTASRPLCP